MRKISREALWSAAARRRFGITHVASLKVRPHLRVFFVTDSADLSQIICASEGSRRDDVGRDYVSNPWDSR